MVFLNANGCNAPTAKQKTKNWRGNTDGSRALNKRGDKMPLTDTSAPPSAGKCLEENTAYFGNNLAIGGDNAQPSRDVFLMSALNKLFFANTEPKDIFS